MSDTDTETATDTATATDIDTARLESYLEAELDVVVSETEILHDGLNLMVAVSTPEGGRTYTLRRPNKLRHTELFNDLRREYRLMRRLRETSVPAQTPVLFCEDESVLGGPFFVVTYLDGETLPRGSALPERFRTGESVERVATSLIDVLAEIHSLPVDPFEAVCERQTAVEQVEFAVDRLDEATRVTGHEVPTLRAVGDWLRENAPSESKTTLVHGDFRPGNVLFADGDRPEVAGVLDWETSMLGDPLTELGYFLLDWRDDGDPALSLVDLEAKYPDDDAMQWVRELNERGFYPSATATGRLSRRSLVARYEDATGTAFENERFYRAHAAFMLATVWEDLDRHRVETGGESDRGPLVEYMALLADSIVRGEFPL